MAKDTELDIFAEAEAEAEKLEQQQQVKSFKRDERIISLNESKTLLFRLVPNIKTVKDDTGKDKMKVTTYLPYERYSFKSPITGRTVHGGVNPLIFDKEARDVWAEKRMELFQTKTAEDRSKAILLFGKKRRLVNIYVISDSSNEENNGTFKVLDLTATPIDEDRPNSGSPFIVALNELTNPDTDLDADAKPSSTGDIFNLTETGVSFQLKINKASGTNEPPKMTYNTYTGKKGNGTFNGIEYKKSLDLFKTETTDLITLIEEPKSPEELEQVYLEQIVGVSTSSGGADSIYGDEEEDDIPMPKSGKSSDGGETPENLEDLMAELE